MKLTNAEQRDKIIDTLFSEGFVSQIGKAKLEDIIATVCELMDDRPIRNRIKFLICNGDISEVNNKLYKINLTKETPEVGKQLSIMEAVRGTA